MVHLTPAPNSDEYTTTDDAASFGPSSLRFGRELQFKVGDNVEEQQTQDLENYCRECGHWRIVHLFAAAGRGC
jgi:hypothetical protein